MTDRLPLMLDLDPGHDDALPLGRRAYVAGEVHGERGPGYADLPEMDRTGRVVRARRTVGEGRG